MLGLAVWNEKTRGNTTALNIGLENSYCTDKRRIIEVFGEMLKVRIRSIVMRRFASQVSFGVGGIRS